MVKFGILFSKNTNKHTGGVIKQIFHLKGMKKDAIFLGNPLLIGRSMSKALSFLKEKVEKRLESWKSKLLSHARKI